MFLMVKSPLSLPNYLDPKDQNSAVSSLFLQAYVLTFHSFERKDHCHQCPPVKSNPCSLDVTVFQAVSVTGPSSCSLVNIYLCSVYTYTQA